MKEKIANEKLEFDCTNNGQVQILSPAEQVNINQSKIYKTPMTVLVNNAKRGTCESATGAGVITAKGKSKVNQMPIIRENDQGQIVVNGVDTANNNSACSFTCTVTVKSAGSEIKCS